MKPRGPRPVGRSPSSPEGLVGRRLLTPHGELVVLSFPLAEGRELTRAEHDVARRLLAGESNAAIAIARGTSARTVANQVAAVFRKLGVGSRAQLAATAALLGAKPAQ